MVAELVARFEVLEHADESSCETDDVPQRQHTKSRSAEYRRGRTKRSENCAGNENGVSPKFLDDRRLAVDGHSPLLEVQLALVELRESLDNVVRDLQHMTQTSKQSGEALRAEIDERLRADLRRFAEARESMVHLYGLQTYADIMSSFAAGERYVNRVWSASVDGYDAEAETYLEKAANQFADAQSQLAAAAATGR